MIMSPPIRRSTLGSTPFYEKANRKLTDLAGDEFRWD
jgi:hypothetical protein